MSAFSSVSNCFTKPLPLIARDLGYAPENICILSGDMVRLKTDFPQTYQNLISCRHHADRRTPLDYGRDLVASWIFEDMFLLALSKADEFTAALAGADKNREILARASISASSDYSLTKHNGDTRRLELMSDYMGFWAQKGKLHLRDNKYQRLVSSSSLFVAVSVTTKEFALYDFRSEIPAKYIPAHYAYGNKPVYELEISQKMMMPYTSSHLISCIAKII